MSTFLGNPSQNIIKFIRESNLGFNGITKLLESGSFDKLPAVGTYLSSYDSELTCGYSINNDGTYIPTNWQILGYDASIPEYVKYKNGNERVYLHTLSGGLLIDDYSVENSISVYSNKDGGTLIENFEADTSKMFTYGNLCSYSVPNKIMKDGKTYDFCGHNMTIQPELLLNWSGTYYREFNPYISGVYYNRYSTSDIRSFINNSSTGILARLDNSVKSHIVKCVNRTWVHDSWRSGLTLDDNKCEHISDKLWLLGMGNINCTGTDSKEGENYFPDFEFDTSIFDAVYKFRNNIWDYDSSKPANVCRQKKYMTSSGSVGSPDWWWLRSAYSDGNVYVGCVGDNGGVGYELYGGGCGVSLACIIA